MMPRFGAAKAMGGIESLPTDVVGSLTVPLIVSGIVDMHTLPGVYHLHTIDSLRMGRKRFCPTAATVI